MNHKIPIFFWLPFKESQWGILVRIDALWHVRIICIDHRICHIYRDEWRYVRLYENAVWKQDSRPILSHSLSLGLIVVGLQDVKGPIYWRWELNCYLARICEWFKAGCDWFRIVQRFAYLLRPTDLLLQFPIKHLLPILGHKLRRFKSFCFTRGVFIRLLSCFFQSCQPVLFDKLKSFPRQEYDVVRWGYIVLLCHVDIHSDCLCFNVSLHICYLDRKGVHPTVAFVWASARTVNSKSQGGAVVLNPVRLLGQVNCNCQWRVQFNQI